MNKFFPFPTVVHLTYRADHERNIVLIINIIVSFIVPPMLYSLLFKILLSELFCEQSNKQTFAFIYIEEILLNLCFQLHIVEFIYEANVFYLEL